MEAVASIVGISHFGGELAHQLYKLGVNVATARKQSNKISERMTDYTTILDILEATLDGGTHVFSSKAEESIMKHCDRSWDLFEEIERLLPPRKEGRGRNDLTWTDKLKWNFRKSRIELLLGDLEYVKSDVVLILVTQLLGQKIRSYKRSKKRSNKKEQEREAESVRRQTMKAENAVIQHINAAENLSKLQEDADRDDKSDRPPTGMELTSRASSAMTLTSRQNEIISNFQQAMVKVNDPGKRQDYMIQHSPEILQDLLMQWTKVDIDEGDDFKPLSTTLTGQTGTSIAGTTTSDALRPDLDDPDSTSDEPLPPEGAEGGMPNFSGGMPGGARSFHFSTNGGSGFKFSDPNDVFSNFGRSAGGAGVDNDDIFDLFGGMGGFARQSGGGGGGGVGGGRRSSNFRPARPQTMPAVLPLSRKDDATPRTSKLKHTEPHDSGYGSRSGPEVSKSSNLKHTETRDSGYSNPSERKPPLARPTTTTKTQGATKYQIVDPSDSEDDRRPTATKTKESSTKYQIIDTPDSEDDGVYIIDTPERTGFRRGPSVRPKMPTRRSNGGWPKSISRSRPPSPPPRGRHDP